MSEPFDLEGLLRIAGEQAERSLLRDRVKQLLPIYMLVHPEADGSLGLEIIVCQWGSEIEKQLAVLKVKKLARDSGAVALCFVTEAWVAYRPASKPQWDLPPSQDPKRREVVFACATDGKRRLVSQWQIVRDKPGGRIISLVEEPHKVGAADRFGGRMIDGILP